MKIAFNPSNSSKNILDLIKNNKDIIFDLKGHSIYARGVEFKGTDTNTWRPVVDNLTSNSATSSLSANQGRVLAGLINGKSDSDHNHDGRYIRKSGDTMLGALNFANGTWNLVGDDSYMGNCNIGGHFGIKAANTTYPGIAFFNKTGNHLGNLTAYSGNIKYGAYSLQFLDNGNTSVSSSTWTNPFSAYNSNAVADGQAICVWGQASQLSNLSTDTGNMSLWLKRVNAKVATLNMVLDGEYYANGNQRLAHISEIPTSLKNPHALTISLNGTSQGPYDGSAAKNINITPGSIGAAVSNHSHDYLVVNTADDKSFNSAYHNFQVLYAGESNGITGKPANVDAFGLFRFRAADGWSGQMLLANGGSLYIRSSKDAKMTNTLAWKTILDSSNYSGILDSRYYTESEVNSLLSKKLDRVNLSVGSWNPRGYNLAADYFYNGGDLSISESKGQIHVSIDGYFWQNEGQYRVLDTSDVAGLKGNLTVHQYLSNTNTTWWPLIWGGSSHANTSDSTGAVYKSHDKLSWQTSSQTLYATHLRTTYIDLENSRGIVKVASGGTSPYKGIKLPTLGADGIGMFSRFSNASNEGGIIISEDTSVIYNSFDTGWGLSVRDKDRGQTDISGDGTIAFGVRQDYRAYSLGGFEKSGSDNSYVLLGGGGHKLENALSVANADTVDGEHASAFTRIMGRHSIYTSGTAPYNYIHLFRIANSSGYSTVDCEIDFRTRYHSAKLEIRISTNEHPYNNGGSSISIVKKIISGRSCKFWFLPTIQTSKYNYYDVYYESGAWNSGSYGIIFKGSNGSVVFEHNGTNLASLPEKVTEVTSQWVSWNDIAGKPSSFTPSAHEHNYVLDIGNNVHTTFAYSKPGLSKDSITQLAVWNGYELRAMNKDQIALLGHTHTWTSITDKIVAGNEFNIVNAGFKEDLWFNYLPINDRSKSATISAYCFGNGNKGYTAVRASGFIKNGGNENQLLRADGGVAAFNWSGQAGQPTWLWGGNDFNSYYVYNPGNFRVAYASSAGNAETLGGFPKNYGQAPFNTIPCIGNDGVMEIGGYIDYHYDNSGKYDFSTRLQTTGNYGNVVNLPSAHGTLALISQVLTWKSQIIDMRSYSESYWHPVTVPLPHFGYNKIKVSVQLNSGDKPSWATHRDGITCNMEIQATASGWGTTDSDTICLNYTYKFCSQNPCGWMQLGNPSLGVVFLRGGSRYTVYTDFDATFTPHNQKYTWSSNGSSQDTGGPYTSCPGLNFNMGTIRADLIATMVQARRVCAGHDPGIDNSISCSNWFRSSGNTGWYNTTYQGGWYMSDTSWIRAHNSVGIYTGGQIYSGSSIRMSNISLEHTDEINNITNGGINLNYRNSGNISLCQGGGNVGIGTMSPTYKLDVNGQMRTSGFHHSSVNSDNYILLAGGGYKSFGGDDSNPIFLGYLNLDHGNDGTISSSFLCLGYSVPFTYTRGGNYCRIYIPDTTHQVFYIGAATASVHYSGGGMDTWTGVHRGSGAWWLHCYAKGTNEVRVKGFCQNNDNNDSWWGGNPLWSGNDGVNRITVCIFGYVKFR